jgi:hypothetical protein
MESAVMDNVTVSRADSVFNIARFRRFNELGHFPIALEADDFNQVGRDGAVDGSGASRIGIAKCWPVDVTFQSSRRGRAE